MRADRAGGVGPREGRLNVPRILVVAGSDSGGGAGIQADVKTVMALGGYATTVITALTAQNTVGVQSVLGVPAHFVAEQFRAVMQDIGADVIKTGMLGARDVVDVVADLVAEAGRKLVLDPVMVATSGETLLDPDAVAVLKARLVPQAAVLTPNIPEAEILLGRGIGSLKEQREAAVRLLDLGPAAVLLKGSHLPGDGIADFLATKDGVTVFAMPRIRTRHTHGTGCTLASAIAVGLAQGHTLVQAASRARRYVREAIASAPGIGAGHGPLNHAVAVSNKR